MTLILDIGHNVVILSGLLALLEGTVLLEHLVTGGLLLCGGDVYVVVDNFVVFVHVKVDFRSLGDVKLEGEVLAGFPGKLGLVL